MSLPYPAPHKVSPVLVACVLILAGCSTLQTPNATRLSSQRIGAVVEIIPPVGWEGPVHLGGDAYDKWGFTHSAPLASYLEVRIDDLKSNGFCFGIASAAEVVAKEKTGDTFDLTDPKADRIATIPINGKKSSVYAVRDIPGFQYVTGVRFGDKVLTVALSSESKEAFSQYRTTYLAFLKSLRIVNEQ